MWRKLVGPALFTLAVVILLLVLAHLSHGATSEKLVAITIDDGPKRYVLYGLRQATLEPTGVPGLLEVLDKVQAKATFFVIGWKLDPSNKTNAGNIAAAKDVHNRKHEIENHTNGHGPFKKMVSLRGEEWVLKDIELGSERIKAITGEKPKFVRPPEWSIWPEIKDEIEARGYRVVTKSVNGIHMPPLLVDVDTEDWAYYEKDPKKRPACAQVTPQTDWINCLVKETLKKIESRERLGLYGHLLVFHELPLSSDALLEIIPELQSRGYKFVTLREYFRVYGGEK